MSTTGAELLSVKKQNEEYIWTGDPEIWALHSPLLFPICGVVKDNKYIYDGKEYNMKIHGYGRFLEFEVESQKENKIVFLHRYDEETLKCYPFKYELRVIYTLVDSSLKVEYNVKNLSSSAMYFSIGAHEGYNCPEGIEEYSVIFQEKEDLVHNIYNDGLLEYETKNIGNGAIELPLKYDYFKDNALTFLNLKSKEFCLINRKTGKIIKLKIDNNHSSFSIWTRQGNPYICLEPWCGMPDFVDSDSNIKNKNGIIILEGCSNKTITHEILF